eukprot:5076364-Lingulodinium_polyedra.AAC.1
MAPRHRLDQIDRATHNVEPKLPEPYRGCAHPQITRLKPRLKHYRTAAPLMHRKHTQTAND